MGSKFVVQNIKKSYPEIPLGRAKNIQGQKFGKLLALYRTKNKGKITMWVAQCECGNIITVSSSNLQQQKTKSCGCLKLEKANDLIGKTFGRLTVIEKTEKRTKSRQIIWKCKCECGSECEIRGDSLIRGLTQSCGCLQREKAKKIGEQCAIDISNQKFGFLTALSPTEQRDYGTVVWKCQCDCGNIDYVGAGRLISGNKVSCGCAKLSSGELIISNLLKENNIEFEMQKIFDDCRFIDSKLPARFDFYINQQYIIEYDGKQHFSFSEHGWYTEDKYKKIVEHDKYKEKWCQSKNIPLIRIPYTHQNITIKDLLLDTSQFLVKTKRTWFLNEQ